MDFLNEILEFRFYNYVKSLHLIFVVTWFAGLFYIPRLFVYQIEAHAKPEPDKSILLKQLKIMTSRLWFIITWPSAVLTVFFAVWLLILRPGLLEYSWMHIKLGFVLLLFIYHIKTHFIQKELQTDIVKWTSNGMRIYNEGATLILFSVVFLVIVQSAINWIYGLVGLLVFAVILMLLFKLYKRIREKNNS
ncbi:MULTISPECIES: CopD family protein [Nonlabens]|uniref:Protoporphyrinogen IX oxidase n=1 Tax=Nonlabens xylanidelens TaxID=191564 RepID=A0A2S6IFI5_9FLAO|nr:CopD family protein [Nonlabens xylanidelens]PPK92971.1 putative membrane protein [Nonlabens xylanidelens]PQJ18817.1 protoporphyrinogen IX oxidase [Nonlabens xylanidelens]